MSRTVITSFVLAGFAVFATSRAADAAFDVVPAPGAPPIHVRVTTTSAGADGPRTIDADLIVRRTGPASAVVQQNADITPVDVAPDGTLHAHAPAGATATGDLVDILAALNVAHDVTGAAGAGSRDGWTAAIPLPTAPAGAPEVPLMVPMHAVAASGPADFDIDGTGETTIEAPAGQRRQRARQGGFNGGFGGFGGGRGGFGGGPSGGGSPDGGPPGGAGDEPGGAGEPPRARSPITLDLHVTGHVAHNALARMSVVATRRIVIGGLTYTNVGTSTIDVVR
jgi:hypothetical protein